MIPQQQQKKKTESSSELLELIQVPLSISSESPEELSFILLMFKNNFSF